MKILHNGQLKDALYIVVESDAYSDDISEYTFDTKPEALEQLKNSENKAYLITVEPEDDSSIVAVDVEPYT